MVLISETSSTSPASKNPSKGNPFTKEFEEFANDTLRKWKVPGLSIAVVDGDEVYAEGYGFATLPDIPATPETLWYTGSTTKAQVDAVLAQLIDSKEHPVLAKGWKTPIQSIIRDDFVTKDPWATKHLTLEDAASHRTGMTSHDNAWTHKRDGTQVTIKDVVRNLRNLPYAAEPRAKFQYNNAMYVTLSHVIETLTNEWLGNTLRRLLWEPLRMQSTHFSLQDALNSKGHVATGYYWDKEREQYQKVRPLELEEISGAGAVISSVLDYTKWIKCLLTQGAPLSQKVHQDIRTPRMYDQYNYAPIAGSAVTLYSLGWWRAEHQGHVVYMHSGSTDSIKTQLFWLPEHNYGVVAIGNGATTADGADVSLVWRLIYDRLGVPEGDRVDYGQVVRQRNDKARDALKRMADVVFPDKPSPPLPPTLPTGKLTGTYHDAGYGTLTLHEEPHPDRPGERILVADRPYMTFSYRMEFEHASGDFWLLRFQQIHVPIAIPDVQGAEFRFGVDGSVEGFLVEWKEYGGEAAASQGSSFFQRVK